MYIHVYPEARYYTNEQSNDPPPLSFYIQSTLICFVVLRYTYIHVCTSFNHYRLWRYVLESPEVHVYTCIYMCVLLSLPFQKHHQGETLLDEVAKHLDLLEKDYFGLAYTDEGMMVGVCVYSSFMYFGACVMRGTLLPSIPCVYTSNTKCIQGLQHTYKNVHVHVYTHTVTHALTHTCTCTLYICQCPQCDVYLHLWL